MTRITGAASVISGLQRRLMNRVPVVSSSVRWDNDQLGCSVFIVHGESDLSNSCFWNEMQGLLYVESFIEKFISVCAMRLIVARP